MNTNLVSASSARNIVPWAEGSARRTERRARCGSEAGLGADLLLHMTGLLASAARRQAGAGTKIQSSPQTRPIMQSACPGASSPSLQSAA